mgnify:CR=1 FL=1|jgi:glycosyltransferase involved in cell wall biosynthesis
MKIMCIRPYENWVVDRMSFEYMENSRHEVIDSYNKLSVLRSCDLIWMYGATQLSNNPDDIAEITSILQSKIVVRTIHHIIPWKFDEGLYTQFMNVDEYVDLYHTYTKETADNISSLSKKPVKIIPHWFNHKKWYPLDRDECREALNLKSNDFIIGSFQRDTEGSDLKTPKLEKGPDILVDICKKFYNLKWNVKVLLGGFRREYVIKALSEVGIPYVYFENADQEKVNKMYNACNLYVISSRIEGGPQAIFEASATKTKIISTNCGQATNILDKECIVLLNNNDEQNRLLDINGLKEPSDKSIITNFENIKKYSIDNYIKLYDDFFEEIL